LTCQILQGFAHRSILAASKKAIADIYVISKHKSKAMTLSPVAKLHLQVFLIMGIPFGLYMMIFDLIEEDGFMVWKFLFHVAGFGGFMSLVLVTTQLGRLKSKGFSLYHDGALRVRQEAQIPTLLTRQELIDALKQDPVFGKLKMTEITDGVEFIQKPTWISWGEKVKLQIRESGSDKNILVVFTRPPALTMLIVDGKNKVNIERIEKLVSTAM
jgi:hypothetical protein